MPPATATITPAAIEQAIAAVDAALADHQPHYPDIHAPTYGTLIQRINAFYELCLAAADSGVTPDPERAAHAAAVYQSPVFIGGMPKSGTSLMRNLLDGHPQLAVFPCEGALFDPLATSADQPYAAQAEVVLRRVFEEIITADLGGGPHWLLSGGQGSFEPYRDLIAAFRWRLADLPPVPGSIVEAAVCAFLIARPAPPAELQEIGWVEKTPSNAARIDALRRQFPRARFILCVRDPRGLVASTKFRHLKKYQNFKLLGTMIRMRRMWEHILRAVEQHGPEICMIVRYETLVTQTEAEMRQIAAFLGIDFDLALLIPTSGSLPAKANTGYAPEQRASAVTDTSVDKWKTQLTTAEIDFTSGLMAPYTARFGYEVGRRSPLAFLRAVMQLQRQYRAAGLPFSARSAIRAWLKRETPDRPILGPGSSPTQQHGEYQREGKR